MNSILSSYLQLPKPLQAALTVAATGSVTAAVVLAFTGYGGVALIIVVGLALLALLLAGYRAILKWRQAAKANPFMQEIAQSTSAVPQGAAAASRARLDDMRKRFEKGLNNFKAHGKNIYSLPWYVIVGEPGSGKTELIRHCKIGFPPGLQDELQGVGGTVNMDWWFTDHAVILDTAGRLILEEVESTNTSEWKEFLKLLARHRPNCPINGLLLAIPADSLIKDNFENIERKAKRISRQLDEIQRTLGVRFPVFIVITKADLVNGFREYFEDVGEPQFQDQMFGWSNPAPLDDEFKPEQIERHLDSIRTRLMRRRLAVLRDPVHTEDQNGRRIDQVDSLYAFPDSLKALGPRLRRYLESIFVGGTWAVKPLFLRGIYFASSMREGDELDEELAKLHGVAVEALPGGRGSWARDKAYFIRDLFLNKVFREKGLVTRANNTKALQKRRRTALLATAGGGMLLVLTLTLWGWMGLNQAVLGPKTQWHNVHAHVASKNSYAESMPEYAIVQRSALGGGAATGGSGLTYSGGDVVSELDMTLAETIAHVRQLADTPIKVGAIFVPVNGGRELLKQERLDAARAFFEMSVLKPLADETRKKLANEGNWNDAATQALAQVVRFDVAGAGHDAKAKPELAPMFRYLLGDKAPPFDDLKQLQDMSAWLYSADAGAASAWPPLFAKADARDNAKTVQTAVRRFIDSGQGDTANPNTMIGKLTLLSESLNQFCSAEWQLLRLDENAGPEDPRPKIEAWQAPYAALAEASLQVRDRSAVLNGQSLQKAYENERRRIAESYRAILEEFPPSLESAKETGAATALRDTRKQLDEAQAKLQAPETGDQRSQQFAFLDKAFLNPIGTDGPPAWDCRWQVYQTLNGELVEFKPEINDWLQVSTLKEISSKRAKDARATESYAQLARFTPKSAEPGPPLGNSPCQDALSGQNLQALGLFDYTLTWAGERQAIALLNACLEKMPDRAEGIDQSVEALHARISTADPRPQFPKIELTKLNSDQDRLVEIRYWPDSASAVFENWRALKEFHAAQPQEYKDQIRPLWTSRQQAFGAYLKNYVTYWSESVANRASFDGTQIKTWSDLCAHVTSLQEIPVNKGLDQIIRTSQRALVSAATAAKETLSPEDLTSYQRTTEALTEEAKRFEDRDFASHCRSAIDNWDRLCRAGDRAAAQLQDQPRRVILQDYLLLYKDSSTADSRVAWNKSGGYWGQFSIAALGLLVDQAMTRSESARKDLVRRENWAFPLCVPERNAKMLSESQFRDAKKAFDDFRSSRPAQGKPADTSGPCPRPVQELLVRLEGKHLNAALFDRLYDVFNVALQDCTVVIMPYRFQVDNVPPGEPKLLDERYIEVTAGKAKFRNRHGAARIQSDNPDDLMNEAPHEPKFSIPGPELRIDFFATNDPAASSLRSATLPADWSALWALHALGAKFDDKQTWHVPLIIEGDAGQKYYYWIGLKFAKPITPELIKNWPTLDDWRQAGVP